jgi:hypothetical protein
MAIAEPTVGWPAKGNSCLGVKMRTCARCAGLFAGRMKVVSERLNSPAIACMAASSRPSLSNTTASGFPASLRLEKTS